jgi:site-specific recombinase XerD
VRDDCLQVDELLLQLADYTNDYAEAAAEKLLRKCSISWEAYQYLQDRDDRPVFTLKQRQVRNIVKRYGDIIGKDVHPHTFRQSYAIHCVRNGWDIRRLQQVLGHSNLNVTAVYLQFNDHDIKELYEKTPF